MPRSFHELPQVPYDAFEDIEGYLTLEEQSTKALVRLHGGYLLSLTSNGVPLLTAPGLNPHDGPIDAEAHLAEVGIGRQKIDATFSMQPVSTMPGQATNQHGPSRYTGYMVMTDLGYYAGLTAEEDINGLVHHKALNLATNGVLVGDVFYNVPASGGQLPKPSVATSFGQHFYIPTPNDEIGDIKIVDEYGDTQEVVSLQQVGGRAMLGSFATIAEGLAEGNAYYLPYRDAPYMSRNFVFADERMVSINTSIVTGGDNPRISAGLLLWHRPDTNTVCIEPTAGLSLQPDGSGNLQPSNQGAVLAEGNGADFRASIHFQGISG